MRDDHAGDAIRTFDRVAFVDQCGLCGEKGRRFL
jgi:hypothetical protein